MKITVYAIHRHSLDRKGITSHLRADRRFAFTDSGGESAALDLIAGQRPDIVLLEIGADASLDFPLFREITRRFPDRPRVIAITDVPDAATFGNFVHYGGWGYFPKSCALEELSEAILTVHAGHFYTCPRFSGKIFRELFTSTPPRRSVSRLIMLTKRSREVLALFKAGKSIKEISALHGIS